MLDGIKSSSQILNKMLIFKMLTPSRCDLCQRQPPGQNPQKHSRIKLVSIL